VNYRSFLVPLLLSAVTSVAVLPPYPNLTLKADKPRLPEPIMTPASNAAERAISQFSISNEFEVKLWAAEPMLSNPVAFAFDEQGRLFVSETHRYRSSVLDIRDYMPMLEHELALTSLEDRTKMVNHVFGEAAADLAIETEVIRVVSDTDGDGVADDSRVFADGFSTALDGIASGVLVRDGKVWFTNIPSLWQFDVAADGVSATSQKELLRGFGIRFGYTGHDFHGLAFGPDGKLYYSIGDRSTNVTDQAGNNHQLLDQGAVFRSNPDGSEFEIFARGLRNPQELAFDNYGNLLTGDNDCDNGDLERLVYVAEGGDSGWRIGYQFAPMGRAGPWMTDRLWKADNPNLPAYLLPPVANIEDGPSGITYYPGSGLNSSFDDTLFITHFKGNVARSGIQTYKIEPSGATLKVTHSAPFLWGTLPTDVTFAPDGKFYFVDWVIGWPKSNMGRVYSISPKNRPASEIALSQEVNRLIAGGIKAAPVAELLELLSHRDQRVRLEAQYRLAEKGAPVVADLTILALNSSAKLTPQLARIHALWALGQIQRQDSQALAVLPQIFTDTDPEIRAQAAKLAGDHQQSATFKQLVSMLGDSSERVQFFAAQSLGKLGDADAAKPILELLRRNNNADAYVRHAATYALSRIGNLKALKAARKDDSAAVRLGVILAYRHLKNADMAFFLDDADPYLVREAALAINDAPINDAMPALAAMLGKGDLDDHALQNRIINARLRVGRTEDAVALAAYAAQKNVPADLREEALTQLSSWAEPFDRDRLVGVYRPLAVRDVQPAIAALEAQLPLLLADKAGRIKRAVFKAVIKLKVTAATPRIRELVAAHSEDSEIRAAALGVLDELGDENLLTSVTIAGQSDQPNLRMATLPILARLAPKEALPILSKMVKDGTAKEVQAAYTAIAELAGPGAADLLVAGLKKSQSGDFPYLAQVELLDASEASTSPAVKTALESLKAHWAAGTDKLAPFRGALAGGDARAGWKLFNEHPILACTRCHKANGEGGDAGPDLSDIAATQSLDYMLESIVDPNAQIAEGFDVVAFTLVGGGFEAGTILEENAREITIRDAEGKTKKIDATKVTERAGAPSSMPAIFGLILKRSELRDLMRFMQTLRPRERNQDNDEGEGGGAAGGTARAVHGE
jgi:quinoprotein glucose dehydrogenase